LVDLSGIRRICVTTSDAGMDGAMTSRGDDDDPSHIDSIESNVRAILFQLLSAKVSLLRLYPDEICLGIMDDCIASFRAQHNLADRESSEGIVWEETSVEALLRLLEYLHGEINESLQDRPSAKQLRLCIDRLAQIILL
jgi:hypothetical protein